MLHRPPWTTEESGSEAIELAESVGLVLDPWQQTVVRVALAERSDGKWAASELGYLVARQNGKGGALEAIALHGLFLVGDRMTLWTAHEFKTCAEAYERMKGWIEASDDLGRHVVKMGGVGTGMFEIALDTGARLRFLARSRKSGRGLSPQRIIFDEAQELTAQSVRAMSYSTSAQPNRQLIFTGTVPGEDDNAEHWTSIRDRGREGKSERLAWLEWSPRNSDDPRATVDLDDRRNWSAANPALGYRIDPETVASEREASLADPDGFAKERLSVWPTEAPGGSLFPNWSELLDSDSQIVGSPAFGIAQSPDRSTVTIAAVGKRDDGRWHVEVVDERPGTSWVVQRVMELSARHAPLAVIVDAGAPAGSLVGDLTAAGVTVTTPPVGDIARACGVLHDAAEADQVRHLGQPSLTAAVVGADVRVLTRGGWLWRQTAGASIEPLNAVTLALAGVESSSDISMNVW